ncbi:MAG: multidrug efflux SMR transporter [Deltaproteobacteria bacterium]|jgi:small multidrug resistance pump|nr:multidrug efflux SMR transporter [Deltaproteobacteria bacterium]MBT6434299.1 multidrug efflux SMR transporter [Deltaproteobacteria bacterium]
MSYIFLAVAVLAEVIATSALKASEEFTKLWPSLIVIVGYSVAFYLLSLCLKTIPLGVMYAIWSGLGVFLVTLVGWFYYKETLDLPAIVGITLILSGVFVIRIFSSAGSSAG